MSNRWKLRTSRLLGGAPRPGAGEGYAMVPGIVVDRHEPDAVDKARRLTHDALIRLWGSKRRSGVWWTEHRGRDARAAYERFYASGASSYAGPDPEVMAVFEGNPNVCLITAWAVVEAGPAPNPSGLREWRHL